MNSLAERFLRAGFSVVGFDCDAARGASLESLGGVAADSDVGGAAFSESEYGGAGVSGVGAGGDRDEAADGGDVHYRSRFAAG